MPIRIVEAPEKRGVATRATDRHRPGYCCRNREGWAAQKKGSPALRVSLSAVS
jgi:hypothetical protein